MPEQVRDDHAILAQARAVRLGTPINFLDHGQALGKDFYRFRADLDLANDLATDHEKTVRFERALATIYERIQTFCVRKTKDDAGISLPDKEIANLPVELEQRQRTLYDKFRKELRAQVIKRGQPVIDDLDTEHARQQLKAFLDFLGQQPSGTLIVAVPWQARATAHNMTNRMAKSKVQVIILDHIKR